jgi:hypothetical protein
MRTTKILSSLVLATAMFFTAQAQDLSRHQVPSIVLNSFKSQFPKAVDIDWEKGKSGHFEVYDAEGKVIRHEQEVRVRDLPTEIKNSVKSNYKGFRIFEADKLQTGNVVVYKLDLISFTQKFEIIVDAKGELVEGFIWN